MNFSGLLRQYICFAAGTWLGSIVAGALEVLFRDIAPRPSDLPFAWLIILYIPFSLFLAVLYAAWLAMRSRVCSSSIAARCLISFSLGFVYLPLALGAIPLLIRVTGQGQGTLIGWCVGALIFGLPVVAAETMYRISRRTSAPGRS